MPFYTDDAQLRGCLQALFSRVGRERPSAVQSILAARLIIRLRCHSPAAEITLDGRQGSVRVTYGPSPLRPDVDVSMSADTLHRILLSDLTVGHALAGGEMRVHGAVWKALPLADVLHAGQTFYRGIRREHGLDGGHSAPTSL